MGAKIGSFLATLLLSIPLAAVGLMAVFGVPQVVPAGADPRDQINRGPGRRSLWETITGDNFSQPERGNENPGWNDAPRFASAEDPYSARPAINPAPGQNATQNAPLGHSQNPYPPQQGGGFGQQPPPHPLSIPNSGMQPMSGPGGNGFGMTPREAALADARLTPVENMAPAGNIPQMNWQEAQLRLTQLGIDNFHVTRGLDAGSFLVVCAYMPPESPHVTHRFEAEAADPLLATNKVLGQIQRWMETRYQASNFPPRNSRLSLGNEGAGR